MKARVYRCTYCKAEMAVSAAAFVQNQFCTGCYDERIALSAPSEHTAYPVGGDYVQLRPVEQPIDDTEENE